METNKLLWKWNIDHSKYKTGGYVLYPNLFFMDLQLIHIFKTSFTIGHTIPGIDTCKLVVGGWNGLKQNKEMDTYFILWN